MIQGYFSNDKNEYFPPIIEAFVNRRSFKSIDWAVDIVNDEEFEVYFVNAHWTDEEIDKFYDVTGNVKKRMTLGGYINMDERKWDDMIKESIVRTSNDTD
ncbi:unnamed protein product [Cuscuta epithymum]|uniref:Uncharacterized protein n=1 Tax=Cuscuta epithymum TaxID=186058 RepID=A0AAV0GKY4_9ASTE|nr:unnamed protein product [Cuscuta epithymum]